MKYNSTSVGGNVEILAADDFKAVPITLAESNTPYMAGTPLTIGGEAALDGTNAVGILLYDADASVNPNAAMVVEGIVDYKKIVAHASVTATAATLHTAIPAIFFRENIGVYVAPVEDDSTGDAT